LVSELDAKYCSFENHFNEFIHERENADILYKLDEIFKKLANISTTIEKHMKTTEKHEEQSKHNIQPTININLFFFK